MGARNYSGGVSFRLWAPFAESVHVVGDFNAWNVSAHSLTPEGQGYWSVDVPGAELGQQYKYVIHNGDLMWKNDPYAREVVNSSGNSVVAKGAFDWGDQRGYHMPPWHELVIYEAHAGTFNDAPGGVPGTFDTLIDKLEYLASLGINAINVLPAAEFPTGVSLGYNPSHLFAIEREYGGPDAFQRFVRIAHEWGIAVILDVTYNHMGPNDLDLKRFDGWWQDSHPDGIYFYDADRIWTPWGGPRPDYGRREVRQFLRDNVLHWLETFHVDGLRFDGTNYIRTINNDWRNLPDGWSLMQWMNDEVDWRVPWKLMIAEDMQQNPWVTELTRSGGAGFDAQWDAGFVHPVREILAATWDSERDLERIEEAIYHRYNDDALHRVVYTESHDESGAASGKRRLTEDISPGLPESWEAKKRSTLGAALVMTAPGIPMIFQGQEFLEGGAFSDANPLDWSRRQRFAGLVNLYSDLIRLRRNWYDTTRGLRGQHVHVFHRNSASKVLAYHRWDVGGACDDVVVVLNLSAQPFDTYHLGFPRDGLWRVRFNSDWGGYDSTFWNRPSYDTVASPGTGDPMPFGANVGLGPYSAVILSQD